MSAAELWQIVSIGGGTAVLAFVVAGFMAGQLYTRGAMEEKNKQIAKLELDIKGVERERDTYREMAFGTLNSSKAVAETVARLIGQQQP